MLIRALEAIRIWDVFIKTNLNGLRFWFFFQMSVRKFQPPKPKFEPIDRNKTYLYIIEVI